MPQGYNILFVLVDQEHFFPKWPFPVPAREAIKKKAVTFLNHQAASCVCSSARSVVYTGQHIQHTGIADNLNYVWQRDLRQASRPSATVSANSDTMPPTRASGTCPPISISRPRPSMRRCGRTATPSRPMVSRTSSASAT